MTTTSRIEALVPKADFWGAAEVAHLCAGGETAALHSHAAAVERFFAQKSGGMAGREDGLMGLLARCRRQVGALLGVDPADIAFLSSASEGLNQLAAGLDWRPGDNVVIEDIEYPSDIYPWARLAQVGVEVRVARQWGGEPAPERLAALMDERTRVLAVSQVSYLTGRRYDLADLAALCAPTETLLSVDATHAAGVVPVAARHADILVSSCYKFLLGVHGAAIFYRNPRRLADLAPQAIGWHSITGERSIAAPTEYALRSDAARFEAGNPPFLALAVLSNALDYLDAIGIERIERHVLALGGLLRDELAHRGYDLLTPAAPARRGPNICFACADPDALVAGLARRGVLVWGGDGRIRVSFHAYNDAADVERLLAALDELRVGS
ncbi:MAG TPA: aminotransferase class V-fold PLP-dependent enzyme [Thermomicrobiales bacterium]|nr:aminotransferase class V-fold PLP-dependent enzyme [Thermomicrobiales bacterium]